MVDLSLELRSEHVYVAPGGQGAPMFIKPVLEAEWGHHVHGVHGERRLPEDFV